MVNKMWKSHLNKQSQKLLRITHSYINNYINTNNHFSFQYLEGFDGYQHFHRHNNNNNIYIL